tara:strand:+ start:153 stop:452 length:300 start_codon:yes stop_codon:yes gene_type:complete
MNPKDAIEALMIKQAQMMAEAKAMALRADKLKRIVDLQDNPYDGWVLVSLDIQGTRANRIGIKHPSGVFVRLNCNVELEMEDENGDIVKLSEYIGGEEE